MARCRPVSSPPTYAVMVHLLDDAVGSLLNALDEEGIADETDTGRHSLGTKDGTKVKTRLQQLELVQPIEHGLAESSAQPPETESQLNLEQGRNQCESHIKQPRIVRGVRLRSVQRYKPVLDECISFVISRRVLNWNDTDKSLLEQYAAHLEQVGFAHRTIYLEINTVKQIFKQGHRVFHNTELR